MNRIKFKELDYRSGENLSPHTHDEGQVLFARSGTMEVKAGNLLLILPPSRIAWVPPKTVHSIRFRTNTKMRTAFIDASLVNHTFNRVIACQASELFRALLIRLAEKHEYNKNHNDLLQRALIQELHLLEQEPFSLIFPTDFRAQKVAEALLENPSNSFKIKDWGEVANCSAKTLGRLFLKDTGITFQLWRRHLRLLLIHDKLESGVPITKAAHEVGFSTSSALTEAYTQTFGFPPSKLLKVKKSDQ